MKKLAILTFALATACASAWAIPAKPGPIAFVQPDGTEISIFMQGDERGHVVLSEDGYLLLNNRGAYYYAQINGNGSLVPSAFVARPAAMRSKAEKAFLQTLDAKKLLDAYVERNQKAPVRRTPNVGLFSDSKFPAQGDQRGIVILVEFQDRKFVVGDRAHQLFDDMLNKEGFSEYGATGSVRDWFVHSSNGRFTPVFDVYGPVTLSRNMSYYGGNTLTVTDPNAYQMIIEGCQLIDPEVDFSQYDRDGDGFIDNVYVFYAGLGEAQSGVENTVWPHSYNILYAEPDSKYLFDGVQLDHYATSNEWVGNAYSGSPDGIGTFVHEFSHVLGLPDLYCTNYASDAFTPGKWSVLDLGPYNNSSRTPPTYGAFERNALGWLHPTIISGEMSAKLPPIGENAAFVIESSDPDEFFLLENRQQSGWDKYIPHHGMLVWHVQYDSYIWGQNVVNNVANHQYVDIEEADGIADRNTITGDAYPGTAGITSFTPDTRPAMKTWNGAKLNYPITDIAESADGMITFNVLGGGQEVVAGDDDLTPFVERKAVATSATSVTSNSFVAHWLRMKDAESYEIEVYDVEENATVGTFASSDLQLFVGDLKPFNEYRYNVRGVRGDERSLASDHVTVVTLADSGVDCLAAEALGLTVSDGLIDTNVPVEVYTLSGIRMGVTPIRVVPGLYILSTPGAVPLKLRVP